MVCTQYSSLNMRQPEILHFHDGEDIFKEHWTMQMWCFFIFFFVHLQFNLQVCKLKFSFCTQLNRSELIGMHIDCSKCFNKIDAQMPCTSTSYLLNSRNKFIKSGFNISMPNGISSYSKNRFNGRLDITIKTQLFSSSVE